MRKLSFIPVPIFKNNIQKFQRSSLFAKNRKVKNRPQPGPMESMQIKHIQNARTKKRKLIYSSSLQGWKETLRIVQQTL